MVVLGEDRGRVGLIVFGFGFGCFVLVYVYRGYVWGGWGGVFDVWV